MTERSDQISRIKQEIWEKFGNSSPSMAEIILRIQKDQVIGELLDYSAQCIDPYGIYLNQRNSPAFCSLQVENVERWVESLGDEELTEKLLRELDDFKKKK